MSQQEFHERPAEKNRELSYAYTVFQSIKWDLHDLSGFGRIIAFLRCHCLRMRILERIVTCARKP